MLGPGSYNDQDSFQRLRVNKCKTKMTKPGFGRETGQPYYV